MSLAPDNKKLLKKASSSSMQAAFREISANWQRNCFLLPKNLYKKDCIARIKKDTKPTGRITNKHLREYIAASSIVHCMDGWSYLGRGIEAHLRGDSDISCHLGYYAELRAAFGLLATEGIGVFDRTHFIVDKYNKCRPTPTISPTHVFAWDALEHWSEETTSTDLLLKVITPGGLPLNEWLTRLALTPRTHSRLAKNYLLQWGLDLKQFAKDQKARNTSSYRPTAFSSVKTMFIGDALEFVESFWELCEPNETIRFPMLDRYLLRDSLELLFRSSYNRTPKQAKNIFRRQIKNILEGLNPRDLSTENWEQFLNFSDSYDLPRILEEAKAPAKPSSSHHHIQVLARATLLLRVATGATQAKLNNINGFKPSDLDFWSKRIGEDRCLWHTTEPPVHFLDLFTDIRESLNSVNVWQEKHVSPDISYNKLWRDQAAASALLGSCERVGLWGLGL